MDLLKKTVAILLAFACAALAACTGATYHDTEAPDTASKSPRADEAGRVPFTDLSVEEILSGFTGEDFGGYTFTVMTSAPARFVPEEDGAGMLNPVVQRRNELIEEKYNIKIKEVYCKESEFASGLNAAVSAGKQLADAVSFTRPSISAAAAAELIMNLYSVPYLQTDMSYIDTSLIRKCTVKNELYVIYDPTSLFYTDLMCVVYNRALLPSGYDVIYTPVKNGEWTGTMMLEMAENAAREVMSKRSPDNARDVFGIVSLFDRSELVHESFVSSGYALFGDTFHKEIAYNEDLTTADTVARAVASLYGSRCFMEADTETSAKAFREGRAAFAVCRLGFITSLEDSSLDWGIAPFPLLYDGQEGYYSCITDTACGISVPECQTDPSRTGKILTALMAASCSGVDTAFLENLMTFTLHDNASALMMRAVFASPVTDIALLYYQGESRLSGLGREIILESVNSAKTFEALAAANSIALREMNALDFR